MAYSDQMWWYLLLCLVPRRRQPARGGGPAERHLWEQRTAGVALLVLGLAQVMTEAALR